MEIKHLNEMRGGWFAGDFEPVALTMENSEIAIKRYMQYYIESAYCHPSATVMYVLLSGSIQLNEKVLSQPYSMAVFSPGESVYFTALADSDVLLFVMGDKAFTRGKDIKLDKLLQAYSCFNEFGEDRPLSIDPKDLTFVVQGAVDNVTPVCLESIRHFFPESTIIFSTEYGQPVQGLDYDLLVESEDVGHINFSECDSPEAPKLNQNRQIVSTAAGLKRVATKYAVKFRSDLVLSGKRFLSYQNEYPHRTDSLRLFKERVLIGELWTRRYLPSQSGTQFFTLPRLFQASDCFMLGLTEDLQKYFCDTRLVTKKETQAASLNNKIFKSFSRYPRNWRYTAEQHLAMEALERKFPGIQEKYQDWSDWSQEAEDLSDMFMGNNFIILDLRHHGVTLPKHEMALTKLSTGHVNNMGFFSQREFERYYHDVICRGQK